MRYPAILLMFLGCSSGPSVDVPPPIVVEPAKPSEEYAEIEPLTVEQFEAMQDLLRRNPNATQDEINAVIDAVPAKPCDCGAECNCENCQCQDCPHRTIKDSLQVRFALLSHPSCVHCPAAKASAEASGVDVEIIESDEAWELAREAGALRDFRDGNGLQPALPAWVVYVDDRPVRAWVGKATPGQVRQMRREADRESAGDSPGAQDAQPQDAAKPGEPPAWCVRIHITQRLPDGNLAIGSGSGAVVGPGRVLTNHHVTDGGGQCRVKVGGEWVPATRVAYDQRNDLALLAIDSGAGRWSLSVADAIHHGESVTTHGYAAGVVYRSQATTYRAGGAVDARSCGGESGGPVVNAAGELVGLIRAADVEDDPDGGRGLIVDLPSIRSFLTRQGVLK